MKRHILKVQLPILGEDVLVYNEKHTIQGMFPLTEELKKIEELKSFWYGYVGKDKIIYLDEPAPWQDW